MVDWEPQERDVDQHSFEDSERFEDDSLCSWLSEHESVCTNWRGWKRPSTGRTVTSTGQRRDNDSVLSLVEICARQVASHIPFEVVERMYPPVPEQIQLRITYWSFPDSEEDIRLYSCLANGSADEFFKGEQIFKSGGVRDPLQIGFHLSARVSHTSYKGQYSVAVTFDRKRISGCTCTCDANAAWCSHIVAVCLQRIHQASSVCLRAPVSESLSRLSRDQLQKFAQYLISELSHEMLPTAQHLLDDLLSGKPSRMNLACGAPDPTAGASVYDLTSWCLDQRTLHENIHKILIKFCMPSPTVFSDVNCLSSSAPPVATEWTSLLRPLRGREPEGLWNLLSIVREMFRRHDRNAVPLLEIITEECLRCDQIVIWWVNTRLQLQLGGNAGMSHQNNHHSSNNQQPQQQQQQLGNKTQSSSNSLASQHACASLCDEVVVLWRLAALSPKLSQMDRDQIRGQFIEWHLAVLETYKSKNQGLSASAVSGNQHSSRRQQADLDVFAGFKPAIEACDLSWANYRLDSRLCVETERISHAEPCSGQQCSIIQSSEAVLSLQARVIVDTAGNRSSVSSEGFCEPEEPDSAVQSVAEPSAESAAAATSAESATTPQSSLATSGFDRDLTVSDKDRVLSTLRPITDQWALLMARAEGLHAHGFTREACRIGVQLAQQLLANPPDFTLDQTTGAGGSAPPTTTATTTPAPTAKKKRRGLNPVLHQLTQQVSTTLCRCSFLCNVLSEQQEHHHLAFRIGLYGLTMCRPPASSKTLEVRLAHQECELLQLLRRIPLSSQQLRCIRDKAEQLCSGRLKSRGQALVPLSLAQFVFDTLVSTQNKSGAGKLPGDEELGFEAAVTTLGLKANVSEAEHPLLCEGTRRQRGDLAITLLFHYKDNEQKLAKIMDRLLDKEVHRIFHTVSLSSFYGGASAQEPVVHPPSSPHTPHHPQQQLCEAVDRLSVSRDVSVTPSDLSVRPRTTLLQRGAGSSSSGWECSELSALDSDVQAGAEAATEPRSADNSPTLSRRGWVKTGGPGSDSGSSVKSSDSTGSCNPANVASGSSANAASGGAGGVARAGDVMVTTQPSLPSPQCVRETAVMAAGNVAAMSRPYPSLTPESLLSRSIVPSKSARFKSKKMYPSIPNHPSEAAAHFMFELAKSVLAKAGGNSSTSLFTQPSDNGINRGPHRALQVCAFQIGLYALGLHNCVTPNWLSRTYSTNVSWITGQAIELGAVAVLFLCDTWQGHLTPPEAAHIADCSSRSPDQSVVRAAAALALSVLPHAHALNQSEIQRALLQCREQSVELLEKACLAVEAASKGGGVYPEVLFSIASKWFELYERTCSSGSSGLSGHQEESAAAAAAAGGDMSALLESSPGMPSSSLHQMVAEPLQVPAQVHLSVTPGSHYPVTYGCTQVGMNQVSVQMYVPCSSQQYPAALQVHYPGVQNPLLVTTGVPPRPQLPPPPPPMVSGPNVPLYSLSHQAPPQMVMFTPPQHHRSPHLHHAHHMRPPPASHLIVPVTLAPSAGVPVNQQPPPPPRPTTSQPPPPTAATSSQLPPTPLKYLLSAYRVGVLALDTLSRHAHDERGAKFCRTPPYAEDVQWLLQVAMKLGTQCVHHFVACVISSVFSPFILCNLAMEVNSYLSRNNTAPPYRSQIVTPLLQQCQQMFFSCMHVRLCHLTPPEYDDFVGIVCSARHAFSLTNSLPQLQEFLQSHRRHKSLKKELWQRISSIMQQPPPASHSAAV